MRIYTELKAIKKFIPEIIKQSRRHKIEKNILLSIAILENINRPSWIRFLEKLIPRRILKVNTFGIMQINSTRYLEDDESIELAAKKISSFKCNDNLIKLGELYNGSKDYGLCLRYVHGELNLINNT